jgi:predicted aspartyl protease
MDTRGASLASRIVMSTRALHGLTGLLRPLAATFAFAACEPASTARATAVDSTAGEVAFELAGPGGVALIVPVYLNGAGPFQLVLDTGATITCVDDGIAQRLELPERRGQIGYGAGVGATGRVRLVGLDSIRVGGAVATDITACVLDLAQLKAVSPRVDGLLGLNFLRAYRVTLDFERSVLMLQRP